MKPDVHDHDCPWREEALALRAEVAALNLQQEVILRELDELKKKILGRTSEKRARPGSKTPSGRKANDEAAQEKRRARREKVTDRGRAY